MSKVKAIIIGIAVVIVVFFAALYIWWGFTLPYPSKAELNRPMFVIPEIKLRAGEVVEVPIKVKIKREVPGGVGLDVSTNMEETLPEGFVINLVDGIWEFERHQEYTLRLRVGVDRDVAPGKYEFLVNRIGDVRASAMADYFLVEVLPP